METISTDIADVKILRPRIFEDERGFFCETYNSRTLAAIGIDLTFVQDNHSMSVATGTIRGLHFQSPPHAQHKIVRVVSGKILDVAVDIRHGSPSYGRYTSAILDPTSGQFSVPVGFAHGFITLAPNTEVVYKTSDFYAPECDMGIVWNDPDIAIDWLSGETIDSDKSVTLSAKDQKLPKFSDIEPVFWYHTS